MNLALKLINRCCIQCITCMLLWISGSLCAQDHINIKYQNPCGLEDKMSKLDLEQLLKQYEKNIESTDTLAQNCRMNIYYELALFYKKKLRVEESLSHFDKAIEYSNSSLYAKNLLWGIYTERGRLFLHLGDLVASRNDFKMSFQYLSTYRRNYREALTYVNISSSFGGKFPDSTIYYTKKGTLLCEKDLKSRYCNLIYNNLAWGYYLNNEPKKALETIQENIDLEKLTDGEFDTMYPALMHTLGSIYLKLERFQEAISYFNKAKNSYLKHQDIASLISTRKDLSKAYEKLGEYTQSIEELHKLLNLTSLTDSLQISREVAKIEYRKLLDSKDETIVNLEELNDAQFAKINNNKLLIFGLLGLLLVVGMFFIAKMYRDKIVLYEANEKLYISRLNSLRNVMNPHFLFNSFSTLQNFILKKEYITANDFMTQLSDIIRNVVATSDSLYLEFSKELNILKSYLELEKQRFKNSFEVNFEVSSELQTQKFFIPSMVIQPFIENAIIHGFSHKEGKKILSLKFKKQEDSVVVIISDNGIGREASQKIKDSQQSSKNLSTAIQNIEERLQLLEKINQKKYTICTEDLLDGQGAPSGTKVTITLPIFDSPKNNGR